MRYFSFLPELLALTAQMGTAQSKNSQGSMNTTDSSNLITSPSNHSHSPHNVSPIYTPSVPSPLTSSSVSTSTNYLKNLQDIKPNPKNLFLVPNILASSSASSVITSSGNSVGSHANLAQHLHGYPHIAQMSNMNNHLYHSNHIMSPNFTSSPSHSPNYNYYDSPMIPTTAIDGIKVESITPHIQHSYNRADSYDEIERNNNKVLDLEQKHAVSSLGN